MINFEQLDKEREKARIDKCDLFDFYDKNWDKLVAYTQQLERQLKQSPHNPNNFV